MANDQAPVVDRPGEGRLLVEVGDQEAELVYRRVGRQMILEHTEVPETLGGRGLGGRLVQAALERAAAEGLAVVPRCPYAAHWLRQHPEEAARVEVDW